MTEQDFIDYMSPYGTHIIFQFGSDTIQKSIHLTPDNSNYTNFPHISNSEKYYMEFLINGQKASIKKCADLVKKYRRDKKLNDLGI